jgi:hypothetical protein
MLAQDFKPSFAAKGIKLLQRLGVATELGLSPFKRFKRVVLPVKYGIGSYELEPTGKIVAVLREPVGKPLHHGFDHGLAVGRAFLELANSQGR